MVRRRLTVLKESPLPPLYAAWMNELFAGPIPHETEATCDDCAMVPSPGDAPDAASRAFDPSVKCCTFLPRLPNFLVGRILLDRTEGGRPGRATVEARLAARQGVTPLGLGVPEEYSDRYRHAGDHDGFGRTPSLRCAHYLENGQCGVWRHRASVCSTWFCKHVRGAVGHDFWVQALQPLLLSVEHALARWCVLELDLGVTALRRLFPATVGEHARRPVGADLDQQPHAYETVWGRWLGREIELYRASARLVNALSWRDVLAIGGPELGVRARLAAASYTTLVKAQLTQRLRVGEFQIVDIGPDYARISSYSTYDPLDVPTALLSLLGRFDGRPVREVLRELETTYRVNLDVEFVRKLVDFEVLVAM